MKRTLLSIFIFLLTTIAVHADEPEAELGHISGDIFEKKSKWYHAFLALSGTYDDNIFNTKKDPESDFISIINPGIQLTFPGTEQKAQEIATNPTTVGGVSFGRFSDASFQRFKAYIGYAPRLQFYTNNGNENVVNHTGQAGLNFNFRSGLALDLVDRFDKDYDRGEADISTEKNSYTSNLFMLMAKYPLSDRFLLRADCSNFGISYTDDELGDYRNRSDNTATGYLFFKFTSKTAVYLQYQHTNIEYETDEQRNGISRDVMTGLAFDYSSKTNVDVKAGYGVRSYDDTTFEESKRFIYEAQVNYQFTPDSGIGLKISHRHEESSVSVYDYALTTTAGITYSQNMTYNLTFKLDASYSQKDFKTGQEELTGVPDRADTYFELAPSLTYAFKPWMSAALAYGYRQKDSDLDEAAFTGNRILANMTFSF